MKFITKTLTLNSVIILIERERDIFGPIMDVCLEVLVFTHENVCEGVWYCEVTVFLLSVFVYMYVDSMQYGIAFLLWHCISWHCWIGMLTIYVISYLTHIRVCKLRSVHLFKFLPKSSFLTSLFILLSSFVGLSCCSYFKICVCGGE